MGKKAPCTPTATFLEVGKWRRTPVLPLQWEKKASCTPTAPFLEVGKWRRTLPAAGRP